VTFRKECNSEYNETEADFAPNATSLLWHCKWLTYGCYRNCISWKSFLNASISFCRLLLFLTTGLNLTKKDTLLVIDQNGAFHDRITNQNMINLALFEKYWSFCYSCCCVPIATRFQVKQINAFFWRWFYYLGHVMWLKTLSWGSLLQ